MINVFIDTNVFAQWFFIKSTLKHKRRKTKNEILNKYRNLRQSFDLIEYLFKIKSNIYKFHISNLVLAELVSALNEDIVTKRMSLNGIPTIFWQKYKKDFLIDEGDFKEFHNDIIKAHNLLSSRFVVLKDNLLDIKNYPYFISRWGLMTQDAILLTTATHNKQMQFFVSMDIDFTKLVENTKIKKRLENIFEIEIIKPNTMLQFLKA